METCESYQRKMTIENKLIHERRTFFSSKSWESESEYNRSMKEFSIGIENVRQSTIKCYKNFKRCLRYWQLLKLKEIKTMSDLSTKEQESKIYPIKTQMEK